MMYEDLGETEGLENFKSSNKILLVDADTLVYAACSICEYGEDVLPEDMYTEEEYAELLMHPNYDAEAACIWHIDEEQVLQVIIDKLNTIMMNTDTVKTELYFSEGINFRYKLYDMYKANRRTTRYPVGLSTVKSQLLQKYPGEICREFEADDKVVMLKRSNPDKYILAAVDKDVLNSVPGKHYNYYESALYNIEMKWQETPAELAYKWPFIQTMIGDSSDNIPGCPGIGKAKAPKLLEKCVSPCEMWVVVVENFKKKKLTIKDAIRDMRLVNMHQLNVKNEVVLWEPPCNPENIK